MTCRKITAKMEWLTGEKSGYPVCCRAHYVVRSYILNRFDLYFDPRLGKWMQWWADKMPSSWCFRHIPCLLHSTLRACRLYKPHYSRCLHCEWEQLGHDQCKRCSRTTINLREVKTKPRFR